MQIKKLIASALTAGMMLAFIPAAAMADSTGWQGNYTDGWRYYTSDTDYVKNDWKKISGEWYFFDESGYMKTGWLKSGNAWYYLKPDGAMISGTWEVIDGKLYCFNTSGAMEANKWISCGTYELFGQGLEEYSGLSEEAKAAWDEYIGQKLWRYVGEDGAAYVGWKKVNGQWYHFNEYIFEDDYEPSIKYSSDVSICHYAAYALMSYGHFYDENEDAHYHFDGNGIYRTNCWYKDNWDCWHYYDASGHAADGWNKIDGKWYYFCTEDWTTSCTMCTGIEEIYDESAGCDADGYANSWDIYLFRPSGEMVTGWYKATEKWYYAASSGACYREKWLFSGGKWYYFDYLGRMFSDAENVEINGRGYDFDSSGACTNPDGRKITGWYERVYDSRHRYTDWDSNDWSYIDESGKKIVNAKDYLIDGKYYDFDTKGFCKNPYDGRTYAAVS